MRNQDTVDIQKIMGEIRTEIARFEDDEVPAFDSVPFRDSFDIAETRFYINTHWNIPYYRDLEARGLKRLVKRVIRKAICFVAVPLREDQNNLNLNMATAFNKLFDQVEAQQKKIDLLQQQVTRLNKRIKYYEEACRK